MFVKSTICAIATPQGKGAIALIRVSGSEAIDIVSKIFISKELLQHKKSQSITLGKIKHKDETIDEVLVSLFRNPNSYTGEDLIEISCHASTYIQQRIMELLLKYGAELANPGEFTQRAYLNGKMDLSQAEAVADIINSESESAHKIAIKQMKGGYSKRLNWLRDSLIKFVSLIELELDFSEEDVEFADRSELIQLIDSLHLDISKLAKSFQLGNAIKKGIPIAIVGKTNVGKSTLLNALLGEEKAIVSDIAGTTRDVIEDTMKIKGVEYRFIDTAGIRFSEDYIENIGIKRTWEKIDIAEIVLLITDSTENIEDNIDIIKKLQKHLKHTNKTLLIVQNKIDHTKTRLQDYSPYIPVNNIIKISAKTLENIPQLLDKLYEHYLSLHQPDNNVIVSNIRHYNLLNKTLEATKCIREGLQSGVPSDFISQDIRVAIHHLGRITGKISTDDILKSIFSNFCIGK